MLAKGPASRRTEAFHNRGAAFGAKGDLDRAIADISEGIRLDPQRRSYRFQARGEVYSKKGDFARAITDLNEAIRLDPTRAFRFHSRALVYMATGDLDRAIADFGEAIRLDPVKRPFRFYDRATAYRAAGQYEREISDYNEVLRLDPANAWALVDRGRAYAKTSQISAARGDFAAALRMPNPSLDLQHAVEEALAALPPILPPPSPPVPGPSHPTAPAGGLATLVGEWNNDATGENVRIHKSSFGFEAWFSHLGQGSVKIETRRGANVEIASRDVTCLYYVTLFQDNERMSWQLREGPEEKCIKGQFTKVLAPVTGQSKGGSDE